MVDLSIEIEELNGFNRELNPFNFIFCLTAWRYMLNIALCEFSYDVCIWMAEEKVNVNNIETSS